MKKEVQSYEQGSKEKAKGKLSTLKGKIAMGGIAVVTAVASYFGVSAILDKTNDDTAIEDINEDTNVNGLDDSIAAAADQIKDIMGDADISFEQETDNLTSVDRIENEADKAEFEKQLDEVIPGTVITGDEIVHAVAPNPGETINVPNEAYVDQNTYNNVTSNLNSNPEYQKIGEYTQNEEIVTPQQDISSSTIVSGGEQIGSNTSETVQEETPSIPEVPPVETPVETPVEPAQPIVEEEIIDDNVVLPDFTSAWEDVVSESGPSL